MINHIVRGGNIQSKEANHTVKWIKEKKKVILTDFKIATVFVIHYHTLKYIHCYPIKFINNDKKKDITLSSFGGYRKHTLIMKYIRNIDLNTFRFIKKKYFAHHQCLPTVTTTPKHKSAKKSFQYRLNKKEKSVYVSHYHVTIYRLKESRKEKYLDK
ncbi:hypothetical protein RFI_32752 [Reticulomyxa filosa]|uniref:Uncharacterized protein n=1 Tax=Reticulomyxa filosa TaxID=46433 RepID=X6LSL7_RETFI|nr:hypothetical protein RFI_32752 [Reticulomyxa filosa]|eukprot:ETO04644.1 hypothetical protein RFI_32752 [Reticulomyxa filosa]